MPDSFPPPELQQAIKRATAAVRKRDLLSDTGCLDDSMGVRLQSVSKLVAIGNNGVPGLVSLLNDDFDVRVSAIKGIGLVGPLAKQLAAAPLTAILLNYRKTGFSIDEKERDSILIAGCGAISLIDAFSDEVDRALLDIALSFGTLGRYGRPRDAPAKVVADHAWHALACSGHLASCLRSAMNAADVGLFGVATEALHPIVEELDGDRYTRTMCYILHKLRASGWHATIASYFQTIVIDLADAIVCHLNDNTLVARKAVDLLTSSYADLKPVFYPIDHILLNEYRIATSEWPGGTANDKYDRELHYLRSRFQEHVLSELNGTDLLAPAESDRLDECFSHEERVAAEVFQGGRKIRDALSHAAKLADTELCHRVLVPTARALLAFPNRGLRAYASSVLTAIGAPPSRLAPFLSPEVIAWRRTNATNVIKQMWRDGFDDVRRTSLLDTTEELESVVLDAASTVRKDDSLYSTGCLAEDPQVRLQSVEKLLKLGPPALPGLVTLLEDQPDIQLAAIQAIAKLGPAVKETASAPLATFLVGECRRARQRSSQLPRSVLETLAALTAIKASSLEVANAVTEAYITYSPSFDGVEVSDYAFHILGVTPHLWPFIRHVLVNVKGLPRRSLLQDLIGGLASAQRETYIFEIRQLTSELFDCLREDTDPKAQNRVLRLFEVTHESFIELFNPIADLLHVRSLAECPYLAGSGLAEEREESYVNTLSHILDSIEECFVETDKEPSRAANADDNLLPFYWANTTPDWLGLADRFSSTPGATKIVLSTMAGLLTANDSVVQAAAALIIGRMGKDKSTAIADLCGLLCRPIDCAVRNGLHWALKEVACDALTADYLINSHDTMLCQDSVLELLCKSTNLRCVLQTAALRMGYKKPQADHMVDEFLATFFLKWVKIGPPTILQIERPNIIGFMRTLFKNRQIDVIRNEKRMRSAEEESTLAMGDSSCDLQFKDPEALLAQISNVLDGSLHLLDMLGDSRIRLTEKKKRILMESETVLCLHFKEGLSCAEIGRRIGLTEKTTRYRRDSALRMLHDHL